MYMHMQHVMFMFMFMCHVHVVPVLMFLYRRCYTRSAGRRAGYALPARLHSGNSGVSYSLRRDSDSFKIPDFTRRAPRPPLLDEILIIPEDVEIDSVSPLASPSPSPSPKPAPNRTHFLRSLLPHSVTPLIMTSPRSVDCPAVGSGSFGPPE